MSFFKKLTDKIEDLLDDDKDKNKKPEGDQNRNFGGNEYGQSGYPPQGSYPPQNPQPQHQGSFYGSQPPPQGPPAPYGAPPPMPPGWVAQWDGNQNRWYYIEQSTGRSQWDPPASFSPPPQGPYAPPVGAPPGQTPYAAGYGQGPSPGPGYGSRGENDSYYSGQSPMPPPVGQYGGDQGGGYGQGGQDGGEKKDKKSGSTGKLLAAGAGGLAIGAIGGAVIAHELTEDSDDEHRAAAQTVYVAQPAEPSYQPAPNPMYTEPLPDETRSGSSVSSSDREELEERREELREAQEAYEEAYEETYDD